MALRPIRLLGDPVLRTKAVEVTTFDKELRTLVKDLADTMIEAPGIGLAAPQIGVGLRVFVFDVGDVLGHLVNPVLHFPSEEEQDGPEGCLSLPDLTFDCRRRQHVVAHGQNVYGDPVTIEGSEMLARCVQHESDHLDGVLFIDRLDAETKKAAMEAIRLAEWANQPAPTVKTSPHPLFGRAL
ncbi:MAG: peptide deformylase [Mycobacteriales bacterium]